MEKVEVIRKVNLKKNYEITLPKHVSKSFVNISIIFNFRYLEHEIVTSKLGL